MQLINLMKQQFHTKYICSQLFVTLVKTEAVSGKKFEQHFDQWPAVGIEPTTSSLML